MIKKLVKSFVIIAILFCSSFLICRYIKYKSLEQIYLDIFSESYGTTDTGKILEKNSLYYFSGDYIRTKYMNINDIIDNKYSIIIYLSEKNDVNELYIIYPRMQVFTIYNDLIYELKTYNDSVLSFLQSLYLENIELD